MNKASYVKVLLAVVAAGSLSGCLATPFFRNIADIFRVNGADDTAYVRNSHIDITPVNIPKSGDHISIHDPETGSEYTVTIGQVYTAASGKLCGRYTVAKKDGTSKSGLVCFDKQDNQDEWVKAPLQIPLNN